MVFRLYCAEYLPNLSLSQYRENAIYYFDSDNASPSANFTRSHYDSVSCQEVWLTMSVKNLDGCNKILSQLSDFTVTYLDRIYSLAISM